MTAEINEALVVVTLDDIRSKYNTNEKALAMLLSSNIMGFDIICDSCNNAIFEIQATERVKYQKDQHMYRCPNCFVTRTVRKGSIWQDSPYTLAQICDIIYSFAVLHCDQTLNSFITNRGVDNSFKWFMIIRYCITCWFRDNPVVLGRFGIEVELDETSLRTHYKYGVGAPPADYRWILGGKERGPTPRQRHKYCGRHRTREVLMPIILLLVVIGAIIYTDNFTAYWTLGDLGYQHAMVNHSIE
eukprot:276602_1